MWPPFLPSTKALITFPKAVRERLILAPSFKVYPVAPVFPCLSEPARSTKLSLDFLIFSSPSSDSIWTVNRACDREDVEFILVSATDLFLLP